jgi:hypothetical protein
MNNIIHGTKLILSIEEQDLDKAILDTARSLSGVSYTCILTQAGKRQFGDQIDASCASSLVSENGNYYWFVDKETSFVITQLFDNKRYDEVRAMLPINLEVLVTPS